MRSAIEQTGDALDQVISAGFTPADGHASAKVMVAMAARSLDADHVAQPLDLDTMQCRTLDGTYSLTRPDGTEVPPN